MRKLWAWYLGRPPSLRGFIASCLLMMVATAPIKIGVEHLWPSAPLWMFVLAGSLAGVPCAWVGDYVAEVAQAQRDLDADAVAMRDAIERLERGDR
jgi:hypothetical protein